MKAIAAVSVFLTLLLAMTPAAIACPVATPDAGQFHITASRKCTAAEPCTTSDTLTLALVKNTSCYPSWVPCPGYTVQACDLVTWSFDDGSTPAVMTGKNSIAHKFGPGRHHVTATVTNSRGSATAHYDLFTGMTPPSFVKFEQSAYAFNEADGVAPLRLVRTGELNRRVPVTLEVGAGVLVPARETVVFEAGETSRTVAVPIVNDTTRHGWGPTWVSLSNAGGEAILTDGGYASTVVTVIDDDPAAVITPVLEKRTYVEGDDVTPVKIGIHLSSPQPEPVRMIASVWDVMSTARWGADWRAQWQEIEIPAGQTDATYEVEILGDTLAEPQETIVVYLGPTTNPNDLAPSFEGWPLTITIDDDDSPSNPVVARMNPSRITMRVGERAQAFIATRAAPQNRVVTFTSSDPDVAYLMMPEQTMLANSPAMPFTIDTGKAGSATIVGRFANGLSASLVVTVETATSPKFPDLFLHPGFLDLEAGTTKVLTIESGNVTGVSRVVTLTASKSSVLAIPATVTIPAFASAASFEVTGKAAGYATISAKIPDGRSTLIAVTVTQPAAPSLVMPSTRVRAGSTQASTVRLLPGSAGKVTLKASRSGIVVIPASVTLANDGTGTLTIRGVKAGTVDITATTRTKSGKTVTTRSSVTVTKN